MKHCIIVKWKDSVGDKDLMLKKAKEAFSGVTAIEGVSACRVLPSCSDRANRYDLMIEMTVDNDGLLRYDSSALHADWKRNFTEFMASKAIFDYED